MLGARIASLRKAAGMSQLQVARSLKISPSAVGMYEQGRREPSVELLTAMSSLFDVSLDYLMTGKPGSEQESHQVNEVLAKRVSEMDTRLENRGSRPFSRQELAVLFASMLMEP